MLKFLMKNKNMSQESGVRSQNKNFYLLSFIFYFLFSVFCLLSSDLFAEEMLKTSKVKVGEKAPLTDSLKKNHEEGKAIVMLLLSNPMQCENCEKVSQLIKEEIEKYKDDVVYIVKGGQDIRGALDEETLQLKKLYGFVTVGQPWTFIIDKQGVLQKIFFGMMSQNELNDAIQEIIKTGETAPAETGATNIKEFTFVVTEGDIELDGTKFMVWKYNNSVPGPEIRVKEGDTVRVKLQNKSGGKHGMFFHGIHVPPKVAMQEEVAVEPGYEYVYEFVAKPSGTHLYHCSYNMAEHIDRGLYGAFIVEGRDDEKFDKEFVYIIDDWNSKAAKGEGHHGMGHPRDMMDYDITTINGKSITNSPVVIGAKAGEKIRIRLASIGSLPHTLRLPEGSTVTHVDSYPLPAPRREDSLTLLGGQRYDIVITPDKKGELSFYHSISFPLTFEQKMAEVSHRGYKHGEDRPSPSVDPIGERGTTVGSVPRTDLVKEEIALIIEVN